MRQAGSIPDHDQAQRFIDYLFTQGITAKLDQANDVWAIWVRDEDQLPQAVKELQDFKEVFTVSRCHVPLWRVLSGPLDKEPNAFRILKRLTTTLRYRHKRNFVR